MLVYIMVDDINLYMNAINSHGGKITQPVGMDALKLQQDLVTRQAIFLASFQEAGY
jgi:hypothetical protein